MSSVTQQVRGSHGSGITEVREALKPPTSELQTHENWFWNLDWYQVPSLHLFTGGEPASNFYRFLLETDIALLVVEVVN